MITENVVINKSYSWIDIEHPLKVDFDFLKTEFHLPLLLVQDCLRPAHLPKHEKALEGHFFLCRCFDPSSKIEDINIQELTNKIALFITPERLVTIHNVELPVLRKFIDGINKSALPTDLELLSHQIMKIVIESFQEPITRLQDQYEEFEHEVLSRSTESLSTNRVYQFRRQLYVIKGILKQTHTTLHHGKDFWKENPSLIQDLRENIDQLYFRLDDISHNFDQLFALYLSINEQRNNEVMKILTVFATILLPLTFVTSFYGMNLDYLPGRHSILGPVGLMGFMVILTSVTVWYFRKRRWFVPQK